MDAFDADALIYAAAPDHPLGRRVLGALASGVAGDVPSIGSVLLVPEVLARPLRRGDGSELERLTTLLAMLDLRPVDAATADLATALASRHRLRSMDAVHLATAVIAGADRFVTNNRTDFTRDIEEIEITYPGDLPLPDA
jgi:predicted nucleic acid-binding protein